MDTAFPATLNAKDGADCDRTAALAAIDMAPTLLTSLPTRSAPSRRQQQA
jgi:hypothetical protein